jgi:hypothetical protein
MRVNDLLLPHASLARIITVAEVRRWMLDWLLFIFDLRLVEKQPKKNS